MGWNVVDAAPGSRLFKGLSADTRFYFVHSYAAQTWEGNPDALLTWATHHVRFLAAVEDGPLSATQFHPEKSGDAGAALLANWGTFPKADRWPTERQLHHATPWPSR